MSWDKVRADLYCESVRDGTHDTPKRTSEGYKLATGKCLIDNEVHTDGAYFISEKDYNKINQRSKVEKYDVLMSMIGNVGSSVVIQDEPNYAIKNIALYKIGERVKAFWLHYYLSSSIGQQVINKALQGSAQPFISLAILRNMLIPNPPYEIMEKVVNILSRYDALVTNCRKQIKLLEEAAERLYKEWFIDLRFPGSETSTLNEQGLPDGWEVKTISDVCKKIKSGGTPSRRNASYWENGKIRWVKTKELHDRWIFDTEEHITEQGLEKSSATMFPEGTILMAIYASPTLGRLGILTGESCCNQAALGFIVNEKMVSVNWLFLKLYELRDEFNSVARGAGQQNISGEVVKSKEIVLPSRDVIAKFDNYSQPIFKQMRNLQSQISLLTEARDRLLPKLMSGEIEV